jgi:hypothetical protein
MYIGLYVFADHFEQYDGAELVPWDSDTADEQSDTEGAAGVPWGVQEQFNW